MRVLIGCEESQAVCKAFRKQGHEAWSCDIQECSGGHPEWHIKGCVIDAIMSCKWDLIILHPPCTSMSLSGNRHYAKGTPGYQKRLDAIQWTVDLWITAKYKCDKVALENPTSVIFKHLDCDQVQYVQPYQFGHGEVKKTGFALHGLPPLVPTEEVDGREQRIWKMPPSPDRAKLRSKTYAGIAEAMATQWGAWKTSEAFRRREEFQCLKQHNKQHEARG